MSLYLIRLRLHSQKFVPSEVVEREEMFVLPGHPQTQGHGLLQSGGWVKYSLLEGSGICFSLSRTSSSLEKEVNLVNLSIKSIINIINIVYITSLFVSSL